MLLTDKPVPGPPRDYVGYGRRRPRVVWPGNAKVAVVLVLNYEEGSEYSWPAGDGHGEALAEIPYIINSQYRDLGSESSYEYGSRAGIWRLMQMFDDYKVQVTFHACAVAIERNREVGQWIQESGHEPCSHGWRWSEHWLLDREEEKQRIQWAVESIEKTCGERPLGWYSRYSPSISTRELLVEEGGFLYDSDSYADDIPYFVQVSGKQHLVVPYTLSYSDARFVRPQGYSNPDDFFETLRQGLDEYWREGDAGYPKMMSVQLHARWAGQANRAAGLRKFIEYALAKDGVWITKRIDIARWWLAHHKEFESESSDRAATSSRR